MPDKVTINTAYYKNNTQREQKGKRWFRIFSVATVTGRWLLSIISDLWLPKFPFACCSLSCYAALEASEIKQIGIDTISHNMRIMMKCQQQMSDMHCNFGKGMLCLQAWTQDAISNLGFKWGGSGTHRKFKGNDVRPPSSHLSILFWIAKVAISKKNQRTFEAEC